MDRRGKERLIGAGILVALAVAVVPELLSGPKPPAPAAESRRLQVGTPDPVRTVTMDLSTSKPTDPATQVSQLAPPPPSMSPAASAPEAQASTPAGEVEGDGVGSPAAAPQARPPDLRPPDSRPPESMPSQSRTPESRPPQSRPPDSRPPDSRPPDTAASPAASAASYALQLGSFANRGNAENLVQQLKAQGYAVYESAEGKGASARYRVRIGPLSDRESAERAMAKLKASGQASTLISPR